MNDKEKSIIKRVLEKKNPLYDFEIHDKHVPRNGGLPIEECGDIDLMEAWRFTAPSYINRNTSAEDRGTYYVLCKEKKGLRKIKAELEQNINLTIIWITIFISVCTSAISHIIVKLFFLKMFNIRL